MKKILIVDDHDVVRDGLRRILETEFGTTTFGEARTAGQALQLVQEQNWDIIILDLSLGGRDGLEVLKEVKKFRPRLPVLILSMHAEELFARRALKAGAAGYVNKRGTRAELAQAVKRVMKGGVYLSPAIANILVVDLRQETDRAPHETLSDREFEVFGLIAAGKTVSEIANMLNLSAGTISTYRTRILEKMNLKTNAELVHYALLNKLLQ
jgi:two-component system, NarL family, invasion response regulator UvrY